MKKDLPSRFLLLIAACLLATGCELVGPDDAPNPVTGVYVANQGNFGDGNGSVSVYDPLAEQVLPAAVDGLGSIVQSLAVVGDALYVVSNTGNRIDVFDATTYARRAQIEGFNSPRYLAATAGRAFVTNLYGAPGGFTGGKVSVVDLARAEVISETTVGDNPEGVVVVGERVYVANHGFGAGRTVSVLDAGTGAVVETVDVDCDGPRFLAADADADVFVFCTGRTLYDDAFNIVGETDGAVRVLDGATGEIVARIAVDGRIGTAGPGQDAYYVPEASEIYAVKDERTLLRFDTATNTLRGTIGPLTGDPIGAVAYDAASQRLYVGRVPGFTVRGDVTIHDRAGTEIGRFTAGVAPSYIAFYHTPAP